LSWRSKSSNQYRPGGGPARHWHWDNPCVLHLDHPQGAIRCQLHRPGRAKRRRNPGPLRLTPSADPAGTPDFREPAARIDRHAQGPVPPLSPLAHGAHGTRAVTCRPDRRFHRQRNHRRRRAPSRGRTDGRAGGHGLLPSRHGPLRRSEPGYAAALRADQDAGSHSRGSRAAQQIGTSALVEAVRA
jgi:hypothetical protein